MAEREREAMSASLSRLLRTLSSASMSRRHCPLALLQPLPVHQSETTAGSGGSVGSGGSAERCCSSCSDDSNNNERCKSAERGTAAEVEEEEGVELESKEEAEEGEQDELELKRDSSTVNVNVVRANFKCNDMECSLVLGDYVNGFLGSFLSKGLKTNQLVVNTDEKTLRPVARLKEPRDLFALPKDKDNDCSQQAPRWPVECQVIEERITHIPYVPAVPEPLNAPTGNELKPRPVGEENGIVVFSYSPISAVNYEKPKAKKEDDESSDESDYSSDSRQDSTPPSRSTPMRLAGGGGCAAGKLSSVSKMINSVDNRSTSASLDDNDDEYDDEYDTSGGYCGGSGEAKEKAIIKDLIEAKKKRYQEEATATPVGGGTVRNSRAASRSEASKEPSDIDDIWKNNTNEYKPASPRYVLSQFGKNVAKAMIDRIVDHEDLVPPTGSQKFSRSAVGGARFMTNCHPMNPEEYDGLEFESRFESGNLAKAVQITPTYYELYLRPDLYTSRSKQWFYFRVRRTRRKMLYRFSIVNLVKSDSLYNDGMQPVMYSTLGAKEKSEGWRRCGDNICYYRNDDESASNSANEDDEDNSTYTLTFTIEFEHDDDTVFFAHSYPYTYSDLQDYLMEIQRHPVKSKFCKLRLLCRTLAGNNVYYLTVTAPSSNEENMRRKKSIVVSARVHPSETPASWMMKGLMDFITGDTTVAKRLRHKFIFKLVPMLNPDGVIVGNTRNSLTGKDLNRQYRTVIRETYPSIWYTKAMIRRLIEECGVAMYCDMHAHSRKHNIFIYGCENKRNPEKKLTEQVFPLMLHKNSADRFSFESCKFKIQRSKEGTGRIVVWMLGITNSYTIEASFGGSSLGSRKGTHFNTQDYEHMGRAFCETLLDYCDENPNKVKRHAKLFKQIKKIRKREKREQKALKLQKMADQILNLLKQQDRLRSKIIERLMREGSSADEPLNIPLSDYSSDEGNCSSSSDNEGKHSITASDLEGPCCAPTRAPPSSPEVIHEIRKFRMRRMRKVMHELDRIYFTPLFQRKFKTLTTLKRRRQKMGVKAPPNGKRLRGGGVPAVATATTPATAVQAVGSMVETNDGQKQQQPQRQLARNMPTNGASSIGAQSSDSTDSMDSSQSESLQEPDCSSASTGVSKEVTRKAKTSGAGSKKTAKKRKFMPTEKKKPVVNQKLHVDRNFRLWLANRRIYIYRRKKSTQARRTKVRNKPQKKRGEVVRTTLDLPTTDPGSDLHFSTDDEEHSPTSGQNGYGAVAPLRHTLLQSDLQRRYIEEIGDTVVQKPKAAHMPPELIVTTPSKSGTPGGGKKLDVYKLTPRTAPELDTGIGMMQRQAGGTGTSARRTYSWHNLDQQEIPNGNHSGKANFYMGDSKPAIKAITKPPPRRSVPSNFIPQRHGNAQTADDLQLKLSLKKKVWTGAHGDADGRPLAWYKGHSIATSQMANTTTTIRSAGGGAAGGGGAGGAAGAGGGGGAGGQNRNMFTSSGREQTAATGGINMGMPPAFVGAPRRPRKLEQVDLFNACSQKLLLWQQQEEHKRSHPQPAQRLLKVEDPPPHSRDRERDRDRDREQQAFKPMHMAKKSTGTSQAKVIQALVAVESGGKVKRKSSSMMKIAETTQLVTRFARNRNSAGGATVQQQQHQQQPPQQHMHHQHQRLLFKGQGGAGAMGARMHSAGVMGHMQGNGGGRAPNKFKTGGLVITAVQQPTNMAGGSSRRMRNAAGLQAKGSNGALGSSSGQMQYQRSNGSVQANKSATGISLDTVNLVRKVKTKLKKRKSRTLSTGAPK
ncbi:cytosolic carboxypeptidase Nna1 isoform X10 [Drosophila yakuba]|uniref:cytosolic carboxypeptidase Nna1 isoform X10 n=1 Tax=Drosophila yakuba TaxID=7245 RepID=UPI0019308450|nr:cytosolic carboxypeptidase Nna1 isoform X10 [Drosophila yakuba]